MNTLLALQEITSTPDPQRVRRNFWAIIILLLILLLLAVFAWTMVSSWARRRLLTKGEPSARPKPIKDAWAEAGRRAGSPTANELDGGTSLGLGQGDDDQEDDPDQEWRS